MIIGVLRAYKSENGSEIEDSRNPNFVDQAMDKLMPNAGTGFVSVVVGSFARNLVLGFSTGGSQEGLKGEAENAASYGTSNSSTLARQVQVLCDEKCKVLIADCIRNFVSTAVAVYLDKTMGINFYDEVFSGLPNPKHQDRVSEILVSLCNGAVETLVKTSHHVLTASCSVVDKTEPPSLNGKDFDQEANLRKIKDADSPIRGQKCGWVSCVSSTLAVPSDRRFVLDVTGRVTIETI